jgi:hypothetical protein
MPTPDALDVHVVYFDRNRDGTFTRAEIQKALEELGFSRLTAAVVAPVLALALPADVAAARRIRHADSGSFDRDGRFDDTAFEDWFRRTDRDGDGGLGRWELLVGSWRLADSPTALVASVGELQLVYTLLAEDGGLTRQAIREFLDGELFRRIMAERAAGPT